MPTALHQEPCQTVAKNRFASCRLDHLLSNIALRKANGEWIQSEDWFADVSLTGSVNED
jgi:hypothetical protein